MKTSFYVDGFIFYYGIFRGKQPIAAPADKWLDWRSLATALMPKDTVVHKIHYFTAAIERTSHDPEQGLRQETYFRALRRIPGVQLHYGQFRRRAVWGELAFPKPSSVGLLPGTVGKVERYEEKGSDVNLATQLVEDSFAEGIEHAVVVSNDTDLIAPVRSARRRIRVSIISPHQRIAPELREAADAGWILDPYLLRWCRLPIPARDDRGDWIYPPESWRQERWPESNASG